MSNWRDKILNEFVPALGKTIVVADPDRLLTNPQLYEALSDKGFELLFYEDPIALRFAFETRYRNRLVNEHKSDLVVVLHGRKASLLTLPCDLLARSYKVSFSLAGLFPNLSYPVLSALQPENLDILFDAQPNFINENLGENATKDFVLKQVFGIVPDLIKSESDLLLTLLRLHYRPRTIPALFLARLIDTLSHNSRFVAWPLDTLFTDRNRFFTFLQERWPRFLDRAGVRNGRTSVYQMTVSGPEDIPFESVDVRVYIDTFFIEGLLQPVESEFVSGMGTDWFLIGIRHDPEKDRLDRMLRLLQLAEKQLPSVDDRHDAWLAYAQTWAQLGMITNQLNRPLEASVLSRLQALRRTLDSVLIPWLLRRYGALHNLPASPPVLVHHIPRHLANLRSSSLASKLALVVIDGLALEQWLTLRDELLEEKSKWNFDQAAVFAWIPTITSVSRQALFSGKPPQYFPSSIYSTDREGRLWQQFWNEHGISSEEVAYQKGIGEPSSLNVVEEMASSPRLKVLGLVVDKVDRIMHGMELGMSGMHNQVKQWAREGFPGSLFDVLLSHGYSVFLTSDHGNVEANGAGRPSEGAIAEIRGERVRIYSDDILRKRVASRFPNAISWPSIGLPNDFLPLLAPDRRAFSTQGARTVAHGGATLDEIIVPFIQVHGET
ncbi:MAG TPA: BREX-3 system phosphatase PglZ [Candidatus Sulfotelmatobacter sp.]|jgi:hypothetical protein|nr:BREX-3 system phosphatase PglZ [Candidatus Sulfotelmatobacter sp.]